MDYNELMQGFAARFAVEGLELEDGVSALDIDGITVAFVADTHAETMTIVADIGPQPPTADGSFGALMLKANYLFRATEGATICMNPETDGYAVQQAFRLVDLDVDSLAAHIERLVNLSEKWNGIVNGYREAEDSAAESRNQEAEFNPVAGGFLQV